MNIKGKILSGWEIARSLFTFQPPPVFTENKSPEKKSPSKKTRFRFDSSKSSLRKVWIDNTFRFWIALFTLGLCLALRMANVIEDVRPVFLIFFAYFGVQVGTTWLFLQNKFPRQIDFLLCSLDIIGISAGIYVTGGPTSPIYFLYFLPIIVQSFHRDWSLILFYGFGGVLLYSLVTMISIQGITSPDWINLAARIFCMLLTVCTAMLAVNLLRKQQSAEAKRLSRMKILTEVSQRLNNINTSRDMTEATRDIVEILNKDFSRQIKGWVRSFLAERNDHLMTAVMDANHTRLDLKQELPISSCPALANRHPFSVQNVETESGCQTESFSYASHLCIPILGTSHEPFGVLFAGSEKPNSFQTEEKDFLEFIARAMGLTIERLRRVEELQLSLEMDSCAMATYLASTKNVEKTYDAILDGMKNLLRADQTSLLLWDPEKGVLRVEAAHGPEALKEKGMEYHRGEGLPGQALESTKPAWSSDAKHSLSFKSLLSVPLQSLQGNPIGVVNIWQKEGAKPLSAYEIDTACTFVTRATLALENALLHKNYKNQADLKRKQDRAA